jgi:hypothetical protein
MARSQRGEEILNTGCAGVNVTPSPEREGFFFAFLTDNPISERMKEDVIQGRLKKALKIKK